MEEMKRACRAIGEHKLKLQKLERRGPRLQKAGVSIVPSIATIREAQRFLAKYFAPTRLIPAPFLSQKTEKNVYLKLETELPTASFKVRGAFWALARRMSRGAVKEVVACSTGNHGGAAALAAKQFGIAAR